MREPHREPFIRFSRALTFEEIGEWLRGRRGVHWGKDRGAHGLGIR